ncbi:ankyrin repeat domain-containing protein [Marinobacterium lutimaris]|uniref:Rhodanese-like domain-containing protein n=1 Tax=Marinobacterium lutimaris TaxID=568106 RepID=A0A1H5YTK4_9GAMM|nr:ankyrin repeat domain-containing protein [Marinobacterium lutimaris]SEG26787.1 Rhodanese-like domain-containing protein [Marinobacterium lutimaris]
MGELLKMDIRSAEQLLKEEPAYLLDMRELDCYEDSRHPFAMHLDDRVLGRLLTRVEPSRLMLIYCEDGSRSIEMARMFRDFGFSRSFSIDGGYRAWLPLLGVRQMSAEQNQDQAGEYGMTSLMQASHRGDSLEVSRLIAVGADVNRRNDDGNNALWFAVRSGDSATVSLLIGEGVDLDNQNANGATPLIWAASAGRREMVEMLLAGGADTGLKTLDGFLAVEVAGSREIMKLLMATHRQAVGQ